MNTLNKDDEYSWINAKPKIPSSWSCKTGQMGGGIRDHHAYYYFKGPKESEHTVKKSIEKFYKGFNMKYIDD